MKRYLDVLSTLFIPPERTRGRYSFADIPVKVSFEKSNVVFYGAPIDITTSFGKAARSRLEPAHTAGGAEFASGVEKAD